MSESWAVSDETEEERTEMQTEQSEASEDDAPDLKETGIDSEDPPEIDDRSPAERFTEGAEEPDESELDVEAAEDEEESIESEAEEKTDEKEPVVQEKEIKRPSWWDKIPEEIRGDVGPYIDNLQGARREARDERQKLNKDVEDRLKAYESTLQEKINETIKAQQPPPEPVPVPDPDLEPEEYTAYLTNREADLTAREQVINQQDDTDSKNRALEDLVAAQEAAVREAHPDYNEVIERGRQEAISHFQSQYEIANYPDPVGRATAEVRNLMYNKANEINSQGGNFAKWLYHQALTRTKPLTDENGAGEKENAPSKSGEETAAAIQAGTKASKGLGSKSASGQVGELTLAEITNIEDEDEHQAAYDAYIERQVGQSSDWRTR